MLDRDNPSAVGLVALFAAGIPATVAGKWTVPTGLLFEGTDLGVAVRLTSYSHAPTVPAVAAGLMSFSVWVVTPATFGGYRTIASWQSASDVNDGVRFYVNGARPGLVLGGVAEYPSTFDLPVNSIVHLCGSVVSSGAYAVYVNGVLVVSGTAGAISGTPALIKVGTGGQHSWNEYWNGRILECAVYGRALASTDSKRQAAPELRFSTHVTV